MTGPAVLVLHASDEGYGADRILLDGLIGLRDRGRRPYVLLPDDVPPGWLSAQLASAAIPFERMDLAPARRRYLRLTHLPAYVGALLRARRRIRRKAVDVEAGLIHVNTSALLVGAILGRPGGARLLWHVHEIVTQPPIVSWLFRLAPGLTGDRVIAVSDAVRRHLTPGGLFRSRVITVHNGIDARRPTPAQGLPAGQPLVAFVGRLNRWKGSELFVAAAIELAARYPAARWVLAGDPPPGEEGRGPELEGRIAAAGCSDRIQLLGLQADGSAVLEAAAVAVVPSIWPDPFPTVILEAMRAGCAIVATDHGGTPEMIESGVSGLLVPPDDRQALAAAIEELLRDPALGDRLGKAAQARVTATFSLTAMIDGLEAVYRELGA